MKFVETSLKNVYVIVPEPRVDERGFFVRSFCRRELEAVYGDVDIVQVNHTLTKMKGAIRGMHYQEPPHAEIKIVRCIRGSVYDVAIDLRKNSPTFMHHHGEVLSGGNMKMMFIPHGFAHGFQTLEDDCEMLYLHSEFYAPESERGVCFDDPAFHIAWPVEATEISRKDRNHPLIDKTFAGIIL